MPNYLETIRSAEADRLAYDKRIHQHVLALQRGQNAMVRQLRPSSVGVLIRSTLVALHEHKHRHSIGSEIVLSDRVLERIPPVLVDTLSYSAGRSRFARSADVVTIAE